MSAFVSCACAAAVPASAAAKAHLFQQDECGTCHFFSERKESLLRPGAFRRSINAQCLVCHERERLGVGHRVGMAPTMRVPADFPLDAAGHLSCASCHDPHAVGSERRWFLRRPPGKAFCSACHRDGLPERAPAAVAFTFPPDGAVLAAPETVVAGTVDSRSVAEVTVRIGASSFAAPVVNGGFAARLRLVPGVNVVTVGSGRREARLRLVRRRAKPDWSPHLTGDTGQCAVCHPRWETSGFFIAAPTGETCQTCHERVDRLPHAHRPAAQGDCTACHDPHGVVAPRRAPRIAALCAGCHDRGAAARHVLAANAQRRTPAVDCLSCHDPHQSTRPALTTSARESLALAIELSAPDPVLGQAADGSTTLEVAGFAPSDDPGRPQLPQKIVAYAVPPGADPASARLTILSVETEQLPGRHEIAAAPPFVSYVDGRRLTEWGGSRRTRDGRDLAVYEGATSWPPAPLELERPAASGRQALVRLAYRPLQYRSAGGRLTLARRVTAEIEFTPAAAARATAGTAVSELHLGNAARAAAWAAAEGGAGTPAAEVDTPAESAPYLIVTTNAIASASGALAEFAAHKGAHGLRVRVVTENDYGATAPGAARARAIRAWLREHAASLSARYLLLIGNPHPETGDVPMLRAWPRRGSPTNTDYLDAPTDAFYADLSGSWDLDGDGYYGEFRHDGGSGGVDFVPELFVGRIPVYGGAGATIDSILRKVIAYESAGGDLSWRRATLLPMSFSDTWTDGAWLAEQMKSDFLLGRGFSPWTLYQRGSAGGKVSVFSPDAELRGGTVLSRWSAVPYGVVVWWGHGSALRTLVGYSGAWDGDLLAGPTAPLDDAAPAFVFQTACLNGYPESDSNLGYSLLRNGAIATVSASRVSWYSIGQRDFRLSTTNAGLGYRYTALLSAGEPAGEALGMAKGDPATSHATDSAWMNLMDFNLYGDPSVGLFAQPVLASTPGAAAFTAAEGETEPLAGALALSTGDASAISVQALAEDPWLAVAPTEALTPATLALTARPTGLAQGLHATRVRLSSAAATNAPLLVPVSLTVTRPGRIFGRVVDHAGAPIPGASVALQGARARAALTDAAGAYSFVTLPPGRYSVAVSGTGYRFARSTVGCTLTAGEERALSFAAASYTVRGRVTDARGAAIPKVAIRLFDSSGVLLRQVLTGTRGSYAIGRLGPGNYRLVARRSGWHFRPAALNVTIVEANLANRNFTGRK